MLTTVLMAQLPDATLIGVASIVPALIALALTGLGAPRRLVKHSRHAAISAAVGGVLAFWAAPLLALSQRATDAPPGTEALFFTTAAWAVPLVVLGYRRGRPRSLMPGAGVTAAVAGAAALLANWERPSSFSPFVRFAEQELVMLLAGVLFAVGGSLLLDAMRSADRRVVAVISLCAAAAVGVVGTALSRPSVDVITTLGVPLVLLGLAMAAMGHGLHSLLERRGMNGAAASLALAPAAVTALAALERATSVFGANPIKWTAASAAIVVSIAGAAVLFASPTADEDREPTADTGSVVRWHDARPLGRTALVLAGIAVVLGLVSLATASLAATSRGIAQGAGFRVDWVVLGIESAVGWVAFSAALLAAAAVAAALTDRRRWVSRLVAVASISACVSCWFLRDTSFYTVTRWIPAEVQQAYGTEYARITFEALFDPLRAASLTVTLIAAVLVLAVGSWTAPEHQDEEV